MIMYSNQSGYVVSYETWAAALASSACIGFTSLVPWLFNLTFFEQQGRKASTDRRGSGQGEPKQDVRMKFLLSFAVGAILGDIFFHLIPESHQTYLNELNDSEKTARKKVGISIVAGIFVFMIVEMMLEKWSESAKVKDKADQDDRICEKPQSLPENISQIILDNNNDDNNNNSTSFKNRSLKSREIENVDVVDGKRSTHDLKTSVKSIQICPVIDVAGYLNLIANCLDNFTHGLAIGASFLAGPKVGLLTTFIIFIHEIPHEICDYAILVNSGFSRLEAVKAQSSVSLFGLLGTATALYVKSVDALTAQTLWILPFSAGGFLHIALVNLLTEILDQRTDVRDSIVQVACVTLGVSFMALVAVL